MAEGGGGGEERQPAGGMEISEGGPSKGVKDPAMLKCSSIRLAWVRRDDGRIAEARLSLLLAASLDIVPPSSPTSEEGKEDPSQKSYE